MYKLTLLLFYKSLVFFSYSQTDLEKLLNQKHSLPNDWISLITNQPNWNVAEWTMIGDQTRKIYPPNPAWKSGDKKASNYQFASISISRFPFLIDSMNTLPAIYFLNEGTFYISHTLMIGGKPFIRKYPFKICYLDSTKLVLETLNQEHFDYETGKILSDEELQRGLSQTQKRMKNQPGNYDVMDKSKKRDKNAKEGLRIIELLSIKHN